MFGLLGALKTLMSNAFVHGLWSQLPLLLLCALSATFFGMYTLPYPYHLDTFGYIKWIQAYTGTGKFPSDFRLVNTYLYFYPVQVVGEVGIKVIMVTVIVLFTGCYYLLVKRNFCITTAFTSALVLLTAPTTLIAVTHLKEDYNALLFLVLALLLLKPRLTWRNSAVAGGCYGFSLLLKEFALPLAPILVAYLHVQHHEIRDYRSLFAVKKIWQSLFLLVTFIAGTLLVCSVVHTERFSDYFRMAASPYLGQFLGPFSSVQNRGYRLWNEAILHLFPSYLIFFVCVIGAVWRQQILKLLYFAAAVILFVILSNTTVIQMRHYSPVLLFLAPLILDALLIVVRRMIPQAFVQALIVHASVVLFMVFQLRDVLPTIEYRLRYNPHAEFYLPLKHLLPPNALLLGMDNCPIASYYTGFPCRQHPVDADAQRYQRFAQRIRSEVTQRPVFLIPDFFSYDRLGEVRKNFPQEFKLSAVFSKLSEDYHAMTYGPPTKGIIAGFLERQPSCTLVNEERREVPASERLHLDAMQYSFSCETGTQVRRYLEFRGHLTFLSRLTVYAVS
jgi:hypothetical protein